MDSTSISLLRRLQRPESDAAWSTFVDLYAPLIYYWARQQSLTSADSADLVQDVLIALVDKLDQFKVDSQYRFRGWLRTVVVNKARDYHRRNAARPDGRHGENSTEISVEDPAVEFESAEYRGMLVKRALELMKSEFPEHAWQSCWRLVVEGQSGRAIAAELGISESNVYVCKCRVLKRLREELEGLLS